MLKIAICDDEKYQINLLKNILSIHLDLKGLDYRIYEFDCGESLIDSITKESYDIIFSDIEMKSLNGIDTAKNIRLHNKKSVIIFVTSYPDFVFQGYEVKAFNYILKPYTSEKIGKVLDSALEELNEIQDKFYVVESKSKTVKINLSNTYYFASDKRKVNAVINSKYNLAIKNQIDCFFNIDIDEILPLEDIDLCSIFSNTLDNAIEASLKLDDISKRKISLKARCDKGYFSFSICNNYNGIIKFNKGKYSSTKSDSSMHGFGLENVSEIVNKYSGTLDINYSEFEFNILAIIKI
ncbi:two-component response regulator [[Clostridium] sordellii]|uniref:GHKL domain-containing protein n=1 Tax=Paraclostridium sordellii TaxID=1505 RepID=UPI0005E4A0F2|nr:GHKL domain-containing protein [Paeniclostridium sordellii]CEQ11893.1 two-component response regulator [[Clostridium] sordellii] [Paeniclostridium sordellii]